MLEYSNFLTTVSPMAYTTFYAGALANTDALTTDVSVTPVYATLPGHIYYISHPSDLTLRYISPYHMAWAVNS